MSEKKLAITISSCNEGCVYCMARDTPGGLISKCSKAGAIIIDNPSIIPEWCPLEDWPELSDDEVEKLKPEFQEAIQVEKLKTKIIDYIVNAIRFSFDKAGSRLSKGSIILLVRDFDRTYENVLSNKILDIPVYYLPKERFIKKVFMLLVPYNPKEEKIIEAFNEYQEENEFDDLLKD